MAMRILGIIVDIMKKDFHLYITTSRLFFTVVD